MVATVLMVPATSMPAARTATWGATMGWGVSGRRRRACQTEAAGVPDCGCGVCKRFRRAR